MILKINADSSQIASYRPISVTACMARLFERLILARLNDFLTKNRIIIKQQSGFRQHRSTKDNLIYITQKVQECFNKGHKLHAIFFDVASAFDKVWHNGLNFKLLKLKIPYYLVAIIRVFLSNRFFMFKLRTRDQKIDL